jgi:predicted nucleotidyltransferase
VACLTLKDWEDLAAKYKESKKKVDRDLYETINDYFLPEIVKMFAEKVNSFGRVNAKCLSENGMFAEKVNSFSSSEREMMHSSPPDGFECLSGPLSVGLGN